ncbi:MAG: RHS repeat domain-containing protein [Terriglobales bacterium]
MRLIDGDRLVSVTDAQTPTHGVTQYAYDTENNLTSITDASGRVTSFGYDALGRVTQTSFPSSLGFPPRRRYRFELTYRG